MILSVTFSNTFYYHVACRSFICAFFFTLQESREPTSLGIGSTSKTYQNPGALNVPHDRNAPDLNLGMPQYPHSLKRRSSTMSSLSDQDASAVPSHGSSVAIPSRRCSSNLRMMFHRVRLRATPVSYTPVTMTSLEVSMPSFAGLAIRCSLNWIESFALDINLMDRWYLLRMRRNLKFSTS
jgi:hypothetical protein